MADVTDNLATIAIASSTIAAEATTSTDIRLGDRPASFTATVNVRYNAAAVNGLQLNVYQSQDESTFDDVAQSFPLDFLQGGVRQDTINVSVLGRSARFELENLDTGQSVTGAVLTLNKSQFAAVAALTDSKEYSISVQSVVWDQVSGATDQPPSSTSPSVIDISQAENINVQGDTLGLGNLSSNTDINVQTSPDGSTWDSVTWTALTALTSGASQSLDVTTGSRFMRLRADENNGKTSFPRARVMVRRRRR